MTAATKAQKVLAAEQAKRARHNRPHGAELGFKPHFGVGRWQRERPTERGVYPICARPGGLWDGRIALHSQAWAGWWWSERIVAGRDLSRLPPAPAWDAGEDEATATGVDERPHPASDAVPTEKRR